MSKKRCSECNEVLSAAYFHYLFGSCGQCREPTKRGLNLAITDDYASSRASIMRSMLRTKPELLRAMDEAKGGLLRL